MRNSQLSYDVLILEAYFHDVWVECNGTLCWATIKYICVVMPSFGKRGGSLISHEMRPVGMLSISLIISPSLRTYTANIGIWQGSIPMYSSMFRVSWPVIPPFFGVGFMTLDFMMLAWSMSVKVKVPMNEWCQPQMMHIIKRMIPKVLL